MERLPNARAGWVVPDRARPHIRTFTITDSISGVITEWIQNSKNYVTRRIDRIPGSTLKRSIRQVKRPMDDPLRNLVPPRLSSILNEGTTFSLLETVGDTQYRAGTSELLGSEFILRVYDSSEGVDYSANYKAGTLQSVEFWQSRIEGRESIEDKDELPDRQLVGDLLSLIKAHGEAVFVPAARFDSKLDPQKYIPYEKDELMKMFQDKTQSWTDQKREEVVAGVAVLLKRALQALLHSDANTTEGSIMFQWLFRHTLNHIPISFETNSNEEIEDFYKAFRSSVIFSLVGYETALEAVGEYKAEFSFGEPAKAIEVKFVDQNGNILHTTQIKDQEEQFDIYRYAARRSEQTVLVAFQRLVKPLLRLEYEVPTQVDVGEFVRLASTPESTGWEKAKDLGWPQYRKIPNP